MIRENLDIGRPSQVQVIFDRRVSRRTPGRFRTRVITEGVVPSLHVDYKSSRIKQYHKQGGALRTATTINNTRDFGIGKLIKNLPALRQVGFQANRRLLDVQTVSHDCSIGQDAFDHMVRPIETAGQRASALRFGDARVQPYSVCWCCSVSKCGGSPISKCEPYWLNCWASTQLTTPSARMTYDLRRLRLHGLIQRIPKSHRYQVSPSGLRIALFFSRTYARLLRPKLAQIMCDGPPTDSVLRDAFDRLQAEIDRCCQEQKLVA